MAGSYVPWRGGRLAYVGERPDGHGTGAQPGQAAGVPVHNHARQLHKRGA